MLSVIAIVVAVALAATKLLKSAEPFWAFLPKSVATFLPSVVAMLPVLAEKVGLTTTPVDFTVAVVSSLALLVPGAAATFHKKAE